MPLYEYSCQLCGQQFEILRSMKDADNPIECQKCYSTQTKRKISVFFSHSEGRSLNSNTHSCNGCGGGSCSNCHH